MLRALREEGLMMVVVARGKGGASRMANPLYRLSEFKAELDLYSLFESQYVLDAIVPVHPKLTSYLL